MDRNENDNIMYRSKKSFNCYWNISPGKKSIKPGEYRYEVLLKYYLREFTWIIIGDDTVILWYHKENIYMLFKTVCISEFLF